MAVQTPEWHGTPQELRRLHDVIHRNCACPALVDAWRAGPCPAHALLSSQATLDHLLYAYRTRHHFIQAEHTRMRPHPHRPSRPAGHQVPPLVLEAQAVLALPGRQALSLVGYRPILEAVARLSHGWVGDPAAGLFPDASDSTDPDMSSGPDAGDVDNWAAERTGTHDQQVVVAENVDSPDAVASTAQSQDAPIVQDP